MVCHYIASEANLVLTLQKILCLPIMISLQGLFSDQNSFNVPTCSITAHGRASAEDVTPCSASDIVGRPVDADSAVTAATVTAATV